MWSPTNDGEPFLWLSLLFRDFETWFPLKAWYYKFTTDLLWPNSIGLLGLTYWLEILFGFLFKNLFISYDSFVVRGMNCVYSDWSVYIFSGWFSVPSNWASRTYTASFTSSFWNFWATCYCTWPIWIGILTRPSYYCTIGTGCYGSCCNDMGFEDNEVG